jgi:ABC-2 type transport system ATP-binding protein
MTAKIDLESVSLKFKLYHDRSTSLKDKMLSLFRVSKQKNYTEFFALNDINASFRHGDRVGIVGTNGAGKSTLLKTICNIYAPTTGSVNVVGHVAPLLEIGAGFHGEFTGRENIYFNGAILGIPVKVIKELEQAIIDFSELEKFIDTPIKYYSTGMYMRLAFAVATSIHPEILVLDEIFAGGDSGFIVKAKERMMECVDNASIVIIVSHQEELISELCDRVIYLENGKIVSDGPADEVLSMYLGKFA